MAARGALAGCWPSGLGDVACTDRTTEGWTLVSAISWQSRRRWKRRVGFWGSVLIVCLLGAVAALGVRSLLTSVGSAKHTRYEPVDVPPQTVSPRHEREREELERRERTVTEGKDK